MDDFVSRSLSDPESLVGATAAQVMALIPEGWLIRPFPDGRLGFQALDPGKLPGAFGTICFHGQATPEFLTFEHRPPEPIHVLNAALELPPIPELPRTIAARSDGSYTVADARAMSDAATALLRTGLVRIWRDTLDLEPARLLKRRAAESELQKWENWIRDEADPRIPRAQSVLFIDVTRKGRRALANWDRKPIRIKVR